MKAILEARETRIRYVHDMIKAHENPVIVIKANIPGTQKRIRDAYVLVRIFLNHLKQIQNPHQSLMFDSADGPYALLSVDEMDMVSLKKTLVNLEETHPLGRLIDLDLYMDATYSISRVELSLSPRKCYICEADARICSRNQTHTTEALLTHINEKITSYLRETVIRVAKEAMLQELNLEHKFGLVTPSSQGSHPDMTYLLMQDAMHAILPFFGDLMVRAYRSDDLDELFSSSRIIGMIAEEKMKAVTQGINCYKGLIFILGLSVISLGYTLSHGHAFDMLFEHIKTMTRDLKKELGSSTNTFGERAYLQYGIEGARGEARQGLPTVSYALSLIKHEKELSPIKLRQLLKTILMSSDDTVMLKRAMNVSFYEQVKKMFRDNLLHDDKDAIELTQFCVQHQLSIGGSADLLVTTLFLKKISEIFY
jgi:holo-ACP synthase / triphosphoribosyl-dephospho-CoA synthase